MCEITNLGLASALELSALLEKTVVGTILSYERCTRPTRCNPVALEFKGLCSYRQWQCVCNTYFATPDLEFSTLLEVTEAITMYVYANCT